MESVVRVLPTEDCHLEIDDDAVSRHADIAALEKDTGRVEGERRTTDFEREAAGIDSLDHRGVAGRVIEFPGNLGLIIGGGGASLTAFDAIRAGARLVATNGDRYCPVPGGGEPDAAAIIGAIEGCTGVRCDPIVGKPSPIMVSTIMTILNLPPERCIMVGDRLETDIQMGIRAGMVSVQPAPGP